MSKTVLTNHLSMNSEESKKTNLNLNFVQSTDKSYNYFSTSVGLFEKHKVKTQFGIRSECENITTKIDFYQE